MDLQISQILGFAWKTFKSNWKSWLLGVILLAIINIAGGIFGYQPATKAYLTASDYQKYQSGELSQEDVEGLSVQYMMAEFAGEKAETQEYAIEEASGSWVADVVTTILSMLVGVALLLMSIAQVRGDSVGMIGALKKMSPVDLLKYIAVVIISTILIMLGVILLIIPGVILGLMFAFVTYLVLDQKTGIFETLSRSRLLTKGHKWDVLALSLVIMIVNLLGALALLVGLFVTIPVTYLAWARMYDVLLQGNSENQDSDDVVIELDSVEEGDTTQEGDK